MNEYILIFQVWKSSQSSAPIAYQKDTFGAR